MLFTILLLVVPLLTLAKGEVTTVNFEEQNPIIVKIGLEDRVDFNILDKQRTIILSQIFPNQQIGMDIFADKENVSYNYLKEGENKRIELDFDRDRETDTILRLVGVKGEEYAILSIEDKHSERKATIIPIEIIEDLESENKKHYNTATIKIIVAILIAILILLGTLLLRKKHYKKIMVIDSMK